MRHVLHCALLAATLAVIVTGQIRAATLTVVIEFNASYSPRSVEEMKHEVETILRDSGLALDWRSREEATQSAFENLAVLRFNGPCILQRWAPTHSQTGPLGFTHTSEGVVLPFGEVSCDRIANYVRTATVGVDPLVGEFLLGRAMGRVAAHELVHIMSHSGTHGRDGVERRALSESELTCDSLPLSAQDLDRLSASVRR